MEMQSGFLQALFDFSFREFITTKIIRVLYMLIVVLAGLVGIVMLLTGLTMGGLQAVLAIVIAPLAFLLYVTIARVYLEIVIVIFRIGDDVGRIARRDGPMERPPDYM